MNRFARSPPILPAIGKRPNASNWCCLKPVSATVRTYQTRWKRTAVRRPPLAIAGRKLRHRHNQLNLLADEADRLPLRLCVALWLHCSNANRSPCATGAMAAVPARLNLQSGGAIAARASAQARVRDRSGRAPHGPPTRPAVEGARRLSRAFAAASTRVLLVERQQPAK